MVILIADNKFCANDHCTLCLLDEDDGDEDEDEDEVEEGDNKYCWLRIQCWRTQRWSISNRLLQKNIVLMAMEGCYS